MKITTDDTFVTLEPERDLDIYAIGRLSSLIELFQIKWDHASSVYTLVHVRFNKGAFTNFLTNKIREGE